MRRHLRELAGGLLLTVWLTVTEMGRRVTGRRPGSPRSGDDDALERLAREAVALQPWQPDTPEQAEERRQITEAMWPAQLEAIAAQDAARERGDR